MQTHRSFDRLADQLGTGASREAAVASLAELTSNCVACHAAYRLDEAR
jgi:cytochrome c556